MRKLPLSAVIPAKAENVIPAKAENVIPAKAGTHVTQPNMDPRFRGDDGRVDPRFRGDDGRGGPSCRGHDGGQRGRLPASRRWRWPVVLALLTALGLVAALLADGAGDVVGWLALLLPVLVSVRTLRRAFGKATTPGAARPR